MNIRIRDNLFLFFILLYNEDSDSMKKFKIIIFLMIIFALLNASGTSGKIKQDSIIECNGKYYGNHGNPTHWHIVEKKNNNWVSISGEVSIPSCYIKEINTWEKVSFSKCADGDTAHFIIKGEDKKVRFLAIDTPEVNNKEKYSREASDYTCNTLKKAKEIYLEYDANSDKEDKYGRILAFVHVDGVLLEKSLIERGLAKVYYIYGDYAHVDELRKEENVAKEKRIGIWSIDNEDTINKDIEEDKFIDDIKSIISLIIQILKKIFTFLFK